MSRTGVATLLVALGLIPLSAQAAPPTYSFVEASYLDSKDDKGSQNGDGLRLGASVSLARWINFTGEYETREFDSPDSEFELTSLGFGVHSLRPDFHLFAALTYEMLSSGSGSYEDEGYGFQIGTRVPWQQFEAQLDYKYLDYGDVAGTSDRLDDARYRFIGTYTFGKGTALVASYQTFEDFGLDEWTVGLRRYFATQYDRPRRRR